jgi:hypothetical protein
MTYKDTLYEAYLLFCQENRLAVMSEENFGRIMKKLGYRVERESTRSEPRRRYWVGIGLTDKYIKALSKRQARAHHPHQESLDGFDRP